MKVDARHMSSMKGCSRLVHGIQLADQFLNYARTERMNNQVAQLWHNGTPNLQAKSRITSIQQFLANIIASFVCELTKLHNQVHGMWWKLF